MPTLLLLAWLFLLVCAHAPLSLSLGAVKSSPRGWNSYDSFTWKVNETQFLANVDLVAQYLMPYGYNYVVVDYYWYTSLDGQRTYFDDYGRPQPDPSRWPSSAGGLGFKMVADYVHSKGLLFGIHTMRGINANAVKKNYPVFGTNLTTNQVYLEDEACPWGFSQSNFYSLNMSDGASGGGQAFYDSLYAQYAEWGVDFIKNDCVFAVNFVPDQIKAVSLAITRSGRPMVYSLSPGGTATVEMAQEIHSYVNMYRVTDDDWDHWSDLRIHFAVAQNFTDAGMTDAVGFNGLSWPDLDMLPFGYLADGSTGLPDRWSNLTPDEVLTQFTLWVMSKSPLMYGGDLRHPDFNLSLPIVTNPEALAIQHFSTNNSAVSVTAQTAVFRADSALSDAVYVALFNIQDGQTNTVSADIQTVTRGRGNTCYARDLNRHQETGSVQGSIKVSLAPHASALFMLHDCC